MIKEYIFIIEVFTLLEYIFVARLVLVNGLAPTRELMRDGVALSEEVLRLDDGTLLPSVLAEFRTMWQLARDAADEAAQPAISADLAALRRHKAAELQECLRSFDDAVVFLHDRLLDHEALCRCVLTVTCLHSLRHTAP